MIGILPWNHRYNFEPIFKSFSENAGHEFVRLDCSEKLKLLDRCSLIVMLGYNRGVDSNEILFCTHAKKLNIPILHLDGGAFEDKGNLLPIEDRYFAVMINGVKRHGIKYVDYFNNCPDRFNIIKDTHKICPHSSTSNICYLLMHQLLGCAIIDKTPEQQEKDLIEKADFLRANINIPVIISRHPGVNGSNKTVSLKEILNNAAFCVGWHTNALSLLSVYGIPIMACSQSSFAYDISIDNCTNIINITEEERYAWGNRLSNAHFRIKEMKDGTLWERINPYLCQI